MEEITVNCRCGHGILKISREDHINTTPFGDDFSCSDYSFEFFYSRKQTFWQRVKKALTYIIKGEQILIDDIIIDDNDFEKIKELISSE